MDVQDNALIVLVLYQMKVADSPAYQSLSRALEREGKQGQLYVYDNSAIPQPVPYHTLWKIHYHHDPTNPGVSQAYNRAFQFAKVNGKKWLLLADQDTVFPTDLFSQYSMALKKNPHHALFVPIVRDSFGLVSPLRSVFGRGFRLQNVFSGTYALKKLKFINSGLLIALPVFEKANGYDERFPLDFSDFAFINRVSKISSDFFVVDAPCHHSLSSQETRSLASGLERFRLFCRSAVLFCQFLTPLPVLGWLVLPSAIKLSWKWRDLRFLKTGLQTFGGWQGRITQIIFTVMLVEVCLGGGGRFTAWGPVSLRMVLFSCALCMVFVSMLAKETYPKTYIQLILLFSLTISIGSIVGYINGAEPKLLWEDVKPLLYFLALPFFSLAIRGQSDIARTGRIIKICAIILALGFIVIIPLLYFNIVPFSLLYTLNMNTQELFFRGNLTFFYKGFLYLCIGILFFRFSDAKPRYLLMTMLFLAVLLSLTRGFVVALALTFAVYFFYNRHSLHSLKAYSVLFLALLVGFYGRHMISMGSEWINTSADANPNLLGNRLFSDEQRVVQVGEVIGQTTFSSALLGHGFGHGVPSRPVHMEISYLEIFHKQGLLGLTFWGILAWAIWKAYRSATPSGIADAFFLSAVFVFLQSATNQYVNNPIGLSMVLLSLVCLDKMKNTV